jgi:hypothetical protein
MTDATTPPFNAGDLVIQRQLRWLGVYRVVETTFNGRDWRAIAIRVSPKPSDAGRDSALFNGLAKQLAPYDPERANGLLHDLADEGDARTGDDTLPEGTEDA